MGCVFQFHDLMSDDYACVCCTPGFEDYGYNPGQDVICYLRCLSIEGWLIPAYIFSISIAFGFAVMIALYMGVILEKMEKSDEEQHINSDAVEPVEERKRRHAMYCFSLYLFYVTPIVYFLWQLPTTFAAIACTAEPYLCDNLQDFDDDYARSGENQRTGDSSQHQNSGGFVVLCAALGCCYLFSGLQFGFLAAGQLKIEGDTVPKKCLRSVVLFFVSLLFTADYPIIVSFWNQDSIITTDRGDREYGFGIIVAFWFTIGFSVLIPLFFTACYVGVVGVACVLWVLFFWPFGAAAVEFDLVENFKSMFQAFIKLYLLLASFVLAILGCMMLLSILILASRNFLALTFDGYTEKLYVSLRIVVPLFESLLWAAFLRWPPRL